MILTFKLLKLRHWDSLAGIMTLLVADGVRVRYMGTELNSQTLP